MMPTPVSAFSPFTPFTPASSAHSPGGYFDRPTAGTLGISSPLGRRPDMRNSGVGSSSFLRMSRVAGTSDSHRQPTENGWKVAYRMRDEAWSAWEQQLGNLSLRTTDNINLSRETLRVSNRVNSIHHSLEESQSIKPRAAVTDAFKKSSNPRFPSELALPQIAPGSGRSISSSGLVPRPPKLGIKRRSFDPSFFPNNAHFHDIENVRVQ